MQLVPPTPEEKLKELKKTLDMLKTAHAAGQIKFKRSLTYRRKQAEPGHIFYTIKYQEKLKEGTKVYYNGAFEMYIDFEKKLIAQNKLDAFLLGQLTREMSLIVN